jgi:hypothetical protein
LLRLDEALAQVEQAQVCRAEPREPAATAYAPLHLALQADSPLRSILLASLCIPTTEYPTPPENALRTLSPYIYIMEEPSR